MKTLRLLPIIILIISCDKISNPPNGVLKCYPSIGDSTTRFEFSAKESTDDISLSLALEFRWDFNGDGVWDTEFSSHAIVTKVFPIPSTYKISVQVRDGDGLTSLVTDSINVFGKNKDTSFLTDLRDGKIYKIVQLNGTWWMSENLRFGVVIDPWIQKQNDNNIIEVYTLWSNKRDKEFFVYDWYEAMNHRLHNTQGICPEDWHLPTQLEWESLMGIFPFFYAKQYYGEGGLSGLSLSDGCAFRISRPDSSLLDLNDAEFWSSSHFRDDEYLYAGSFSSSFSDHAFRKWTDPVLDYSDSVQILMTVRCIKDK